MSTVEKPFDLAFYVAPGSKDLDAELDILRDLGVSAIGFDGWGSWADTPLIREVAKRVRAHGIKVASCHSSIGLCFLDDIPGSLEDNRRIVDCAAEWGCPSTVWHFRWPRSRKGDTHWVTLEEMQDLDPMDVDRAMEEVLLPTCDYAVSRGVSINLENLPLVLNADSPYAILDIIRKFNHPGLGLILDSGHSWASGYDPAEVIRTAGPLLHDTHFHDSLGSRGFPKGRKILGKEVPTYDLHMVPGLGTICWMEVVRAMREIKFPNPIVFEGPGIPGDPTAKTTEGFRRRVKLAIDMWRAFEDMATGCLDPAPMSRESVVK